MLSVITYGELVYGAEKSQFREQARGQLAELAALIPVMELPMRAGEFYGSIRAALAAKGGMIAMTVDMAYSHGRQGIRVNAIAPGHITTPMVMSVSSPGPRADFMNAMRSEAGLLGTPGDGWDVAEAVTFLASDAARWITGVTLPVDSGVLTVTPLAMARYLRAIPD